ncbi:MAG: hypothetical protein GY696_03680 [Gammaproteobacteria bacterium]|nr:hypothetical protein [Gammaproteobacteria bacterium]
MSNSTQRVLGIDDLESLGMAIDLLSRSVQPITEVTSPKQLMSSLKDKFPTLFDESKIRELQGFLQAILDFLSGFRSSAPENGKSPSELLDGRKIRSTSDIRNPHLLPKDEAVMEFLPLSMDEQRHAVERKCKKRHYGKAFESFRNTPFYVGQ